MQAFAEIVISLLLPPCFHLVLTVIKLATFHFRFANICEAVIHHQKIWK